MIKLDMKIDNEKFIRDQLASIDKKKWPRILADATTETAFYVRNKVRKQMPEYIDRPTPFTINSIFVQKGSSKDHESMVLWRKPSGGNSGGRYLRPTVEGGDRHVKGFEKALQSAQLMPYGQVAVPTKDAPVDAYGNVSSSYIRRIVDSLKFNPSGSSYGGSSRRSLNKNIAGIQESKTKKDLTAFFVVKNRQGIRGLAPGIYERRSGGLGVSVRRLFGFFSSASYKKTFPFYDLGRKAALEKFPEKLEEAIEKWVKSVT